MEVKLLSYTKDAEKLCAAAAHSCYSKESASEILENINSKNWARLLEAPLSMGHQSVIEHACYTFSIGGVSRACTHQLVRHRIASFSQKSQRYVSVEKPDYVIPPSISKDEEAKERFISLMDKIWEEYAYLSQKVPIEDARYVLPNATKTHITVTMNARELWHFFSLRCCRRSQLELREVADKMLMLAREASPLIFKNAGPECLRGKCPEGKLSCGKPRTELKN